MIEKQINDNDFYFDYYSLKKLCCFIWLNHDKSENKKNEENKENKKNKNNKYYFKKSKNNFQNKFFKEKKIKNYLKIC
jgi:hypothetical protein